MKKAILWFTGVLVILLLALFLVPGLKDLFMLDKNKIISGEYWRIISYPFVHLNWSHLLENILGLTLVGFIAFELKTRFLDYSLTYFSSAILAIIPLWLIVSFLALGSSAAVYGLFGFVSLSVTKFNLKPKYLLLLALLIIFSKPIFSFFTGEQTRYLLIQSFAHLSGLIFGISLFFGLRYLESYQTKKKKHILRGEL